MAKRNGNREARKPKQTKEKVPATATSVAELGLRALPGKKKR
jgi:hypothetical protein